MTPALVTPTSMTMACWLPTGLWEMAKRLRLIANLSDGVAAIPASHQAKRAIWGEISRDELTPWAVVWDVGDR